MDIEHYVDKYLIIVPEERILTELPKLNHNSANQSYDVILNLVNVDQITTTGLINLIQYRKQGKVYVFNAQPSVRCTLEMTRIYTLLEYLS